VSLFCYENGNTRISETREEEESSGEVVRDTTFGGGGGRGSKKEYVFPVFKLPRQCPHVILV
jgi:hypothetical protein